VAEPIQAGVQGIVHIGGLGVIQQIAPEPVIERNRKIGKR
jgi:hypothetical protein